MRKKVVGLMLGLSVVLSAECNNMVDLEFSNIMNTKSYNVLILEKLYKECESEIIETVLYFAKAQQYQNDNITNSAKQEYWNALSLIKDNNFIELNEIEERIKKELFKYQSEEPINVLTLDNRGYIHSRGDIKLTPVSRDAKLKYFDKLKGIPLNFKTNYSKIEGKTDTSKQAKIIGELLSKKYSNKRIYITGFTDTKGGATLNDNLSEKRAENLKQYLVKNYNFKEVSIIVDSYGESLPVCIGGKKIRQGRNYKCSGKENYFKGRRVTVEIGE